MTIPVNLIGDGLPVVVDDRTAQLGGAFYYDPLRPYSPLPMKWAYEQLIRYPKVTLIDVGASTGCYTLLAKHHPDMTVYAFEPVPLTYEVLKANIELNGLSRKVYDYQAGISNYDGEGVVHVVTADGGKGVSIVNGTPAVHKVTEAVPIQVAMLDTICDQWGIVPTVIKIDTEGGEKLVLQGAEATIKKYHPFILTEYSVENAYQFGYGADEIIGLLESWGYVWTNPEGTDLWCVHREWESIK